ncbi:ABC transporter substrate-binding protein [Halalkalibacter alkaliphilus]|uniref:ABC transporter substrate-binding protein n=1 Tax=Halalkalibacter alkaliphilus TaxID=2917993 RepID=A0A9X1ZYW9_9BACI|nr:ABC transporter substrate-binding protein [Halalkalibacter alkaliphilus]
MSKRAVIVIILCLLAGVSFIYVAPYSSERDEKNEKELIELTFLRNLANPASNQAYEELVAEFEEAHPHIKVNMLSMHWANEYELRLRTELVAGNHPDIMSIDSPNLALYANAGTLLSLDRYMKEEGNIDDIFEHTLKGLTYQDEIYLAPIAESSIALFYNKHLLNEAGIPFPSSEQAMTWDEVLEIAQKIHNPEQGIYGIDPAQGFGEGEGPAYFKLPFLWQFGADVLSPDATTADGYLNSEEALEALKFYQDLYLKHRVATVELPPAPFESNQLAMTVMGSWHLVDFESYGLVLGEDFGIAPLPKADYQVTPNGGWALGISAKSEHPDEAWEFIKFATSYNAVKKHSEITGDIPARYSVVQDLPELKEYPKNIFIEQGQIYSKNRPVTPAYPVISNAIKELFEDIVLNEKDVKEAADEAVEKINNALNSTQ